jgi:AcrR family transcriptional regulator
VASRKASTYHHGDLRRAIMDAALSMVREGGLPALSLREVARRAGVSSGAPYHHFANRDALLAAIATEGFAMLAAAMQAAMKRAEPSADAQLESLGAAYVAFAIAEPAHFRVMFAAAPAGAREAFPELAAVGEPVYELLVEYVVRSQSEGLAPPGDPAPYVLTAWAVVHGAASLLLDGPLHPHELAHRGFADLEVGAVVVATLRSLFVAAARDAAAASAKTSARAPSKKKHAR